MKAVYFARVSTREQAEEGYSLSAQEKLLRDYAEKQKFPIVKKFSVPESARGKQERKLFNTLLEYISKHNNVKIVICEKVDRITRNFKDAVKLQDWLSEDDERQIHFVKQGLIIHKNSKSTEQLMWDIFLALARNYSNNLSEEARKGLNEKSEQGWYPGSRKRGYKTVGEMGRKIWVVDKQSSEARYIALAFELYDTGNFTLRTVSQELYDHGWSISGKPISISELHKLLSDPFFCGEFVWNGKLFKSAKHEPLISKELFYRVQDRLKRVYKAGKYRKHDFLFGGGLTICGECDRVVTWEIQKGHSYGHCTQYKTACTQKKYIKENNVSNKVLEIFDQLKIDDPDILEWVRKALKESHQEEKEYHAEIINDLQRKKSQIEKRLDTIYDDRVDKVISKEQYSRKQKQYEGELEAVLESIEKHTKANISYQKLGMNIFELSQRGREIYEKLLTKEEKRELLYFVLSNMKIRGEEVIPTFHNGFEVIAARVKDGNWQG